MGAVIMVSTLIGLIVLMFTLALRYDPEARPAVNRQTAGHE